MVVRVRQHNSIVARNFIHEEAQKRLHEVVAAAKQISTNAIFVHATPIMYFAKVESGHKCPCREKLLINNALPLGTPGTAANSYQLDLTTPLFGSYQSAESISQTTNAELDDDLMAAQPLTVNSLFGNATECPICFRQGVLPGYQPIGYSRLVLTTAACEDSSGYFIDSSKNVPSYEMDSQEGYVEFRLTVPYHYFTVQYGVYNYKQVVTQQRQLSILGQPLSDDLLLNFRGKEVNLRVQGGSFTHAVFQFQLVAKPLLADFPQDQKPTDYNLFDSTQPVQIVMDSSVPMLANADIIYKLGYGSMWKVNDFEYLRTHDRTVIGWSLNARLIQNDEVTKLLTVY